MLCWFVVIQQYYIYTKTAILFLDGRKIAPGASRRASDLVQYMIIEKRNATCKKKDGLDMSKVIIGIDRSKSFRVYLTVSTDMVETARKIHNTTPLATAGLGRVLTGAGLMALMMKNESDKLTVQFKGDGPAREILATA